MQLSDTGLEMLKQFEGFRSQTYLDIAGLPTIGYGHRLLPGESFPNGLSIDDATTLLASDVHAAELAILRLVKVPLSQPQFDALVDFTFNLGAGKLAGSTLLSQLNARQYDAAARQFMRWDHAGMKEVAALETRRNAEFQLWNSTKPRSDSTPAPAEETEA